MIKLLEHMKLILRNHHIDITSINPATIRLAEGNPKKCWVIELFTPNDNGDPEIKTRFYAYPDDKKLFMEPNQYDETPLEQHIRSHGYTDINQADWEIERI